MKEAIRCENQRRVQRVHGDFQRSACGLLKIYLIRVVNAEHIDLRLLRIIFL